MSKRDVPARPIKLENTSENENVSKYRYAYSGEPIKDNFITDAEAIKDGYVSVSVLDYSLNSKEFINDLSDLINE